jgi:hypothetical protein
MREIRRWIRRDTRYGNSPLVSCGGAIVWKALLGRLPLELMGGCGR